MAKNHIFRHTPAHFRGLYKGLYFPIFFLKFLPFVVHCVGIRVPKKIFRFLHFGPHFWPFSAFKLNFGPKFGGNPSGTKFFLASLQSFKRSVKKNREKNAKIIPPPYTTLCYNALDVDGINEYGDLDQGWTVLIKPTIKSKTQIRKVVITPTPCETDI